MKLQFSGVHDWITRHKTMNRKVEPLHSNNKGTTNNLRFTSPVISAGPGILKNADLIRQNLRGKDLTSQAKQSPAVNKFLNLGNENDSLISNSASPGSPLNDSARKKLRDLPHTTTLRGCVAYVDVWSSDATDNRSSVFRNFLTRMGATVAIKFMKDEPITHVVFKDGHKSVLQKAKKRNIKIVTCLWVDRCRILQQWVNEDEFLFDPSNYKPPKRFVAMQPLEPDELIQRSAERLKRRKARFAKKNARIMFQSPLVTNTHSANGTPIEGNTPTSQAIMKRHGIFAEDTPFNPPSICRYFSPSVVCETPLTDSMQRMMQRLREGKRVLSPPSSEDNSEEEDVEIKSPDRPTRNSDLPKRKSQSPADRPKFSPVADTQCMVKRSWRESGLSPPKFDVSCDEIPETQNVEAPDTPQQLPERSARVPAFVEGIQEVPETQHMNTSASSHSETQLPDPPLFASTAKDLEEEPSFPKDTEGRFSQEGLQPYCFQDDSPPEIHLRISGNSSHLEDTDSFLKHDHTEVEAEEMQSDAEECTPTEQKIVEKPLLTSRRKRRKLLEDHECLEPLSVLVSPEKTAIRSRSRRARKSSLLLPELGFSAYKSLTKSGRFFDKLPSGTPSECSSISRQSSPQRSTCNTQSTEFGNSQQNPVQSNAGIVQQFNSPLSLYDRVKMRQKRNLILPYSINEHDISTIMDSTNTKKRKTSDQYCSPECAASPRPKKKLTKTQKSTSKDSTLFYSQAARAILESIKNRRSTLDFTSSMVKDTTSTQSIKKKNEKKSVIVLTNFHSNERFELHETVRSLSKLRITSAVRDQTTHVVCGAARRTMNVLRAIARGVWLLSKNWVTDSFAAGFWLEEESYEIPSMFPAAVKNRKCITRNPMWKNELFAKFEGHIYISDKTKPPQEDLRELITLCGGSTVGSLSRAILCVGNTGRIVSDIPVVNETWVLDSISDDTLKPFGPYLVSPN